MERIKTLRATKALKLMKFATSLDSSELYAFVDHTNVNRFYDVAAEIAKRADGVGLKYKASPREEVRTEVFLENGLSDVNDVVEISLKGISPEIPTLEDALDIVTNPASVEVIARMAQLPEIHLRNILIRQRQILHNPEHAISEQSCFSLDRDAKAIVALPALEREWPTDGKGCPFSFNNPDRRPPIFNTFTQWAAELSVRAIYKTKTPKI